jgi:C4-type Zn-finger protein
VNPYRQLKPDEFSVCLTHTPEVCPWCNSRNVAIYSHRVYPFSDYVSVRTFHCNDCEVDYGYNPYLVDEEMDAEMIAHPIRSEEKLDNPPTSVKLPWYKRLFS